jgi:[ribosomal protein S5]-alanine N-acetyltransferase
MTEPRSITPPPRSVRRARGLSRAAQVGERVFLRYPVTSDREEFLAVRLASRAHLEPWEGTPADGSDPFGPASFDRLLGTRRSELNHRFVICLLETGGIVGQISLGNIVRGSFQSCYTGYWLAAAHTGRGLMTEALGLTLRHAFVDLELHRVEANIIPINRTSLALVKRCGMRYEGTALRYLLINGVWQDHEHWAITVEEWRERQAAAAIALGSP